MFNADHGPSSTNFLLFNPENTLKTMECLCVYQERYNDYETLDGMPYQHYRTR